MTFRLLLATLAALFALLVGAAFWGFVSDFSSPTSAYIEQSQNAVRIASTLAFSAITFVAVLTGRR